MLKYYDFLLKMGAKFRNAFNCGCVCGLLTVMRHAQCQALLEAAVLAFVPALFLDFTGTLTALVLQLHTNGASKKSL